MNRILFIIAVLVSILTVSSAEAQTFGLGPKVEAPGSLFGLRGSSAFFQRIVPDKSLVIEIPELEVKKKEVVVAVEPKIVATTPTVVCVDGTCYKTQTRQLRIPIFRRRR